MILQRDDQTATRTFGCLRADDGHVECQTLEKPWVNNAVDVSCIPEGRYVAQLRYSPHHGYAVYGVVGVPHRADIEIHIANAPSQLLGCIALGMSRDGDDVDQSGVAFRAFMVARGCPEWATLLSDDAVTAFCAAHPEAARFTLVITDPPA